MKLIKEYKTIEEREKILSENEDLILVEERNITDGNFLFFSDTPLEKEIIYTQVPEKEFNALQSDVTEVTETTVLILEDTTAIVETTATLTEDSAATAETLAMTLIEIENLKAEITALKGE